MKGALPHDLTAIGRVFRAQHRHLAPSDRCYFLAELFPHADPRRDPTKDLILNFKITPTELTARPGRANWKQWATHTIGEALARHLTGTPAGYVVVPIPPSKLPGHPDYDDRMLRALAHANTLVTTSTHSSSSLDIRELIRQRMSTPTDHGTSTRQSYPQLLRNCYLDEAAALPAPTGVLFIDDVLTDGKHFRVCQRLVRKRYGAVAVIGLFIARRVTTAWRPEFARSRYASALRIADPPAPARPAWLTDLHRDAQR